MQLKPLILSGGTAGAKTARGAMLNGVSPNVIVNTGDDVEVLGLYVSPDFDSVLYSIMGTFDFERNWGIKGDTFSFYEALRAYSAQPFIALGDRDLAVHVLRTHLLRQGLTLSEAFLEIERRAGVRARVLPPSDDRITTVVGDLEGHEYTFEEYFIKRPGIKVSYVLYRGSETARASRAAVELFRESDFVLIAPSNPLASVLPILSVKGIRDELRRFKGPRIAVSPFSGGRAFKGPAAEMMRGLGLNPALGGLAELYGDLVDLYVVDREEEDVRGIRAHRLDSIFFRTDEEMAAFYRKASELAAQMMS